MSFTNAGKVIGGVDCSTSTQDELIVNHGKILGSVVLGHGNDVFNGTGGTSGDIFGGSGHDIIVAGKGGVQMHVGVGNNTLTGGPGADHFIFDSGLGGQVERITNFKRGADKIVLSAADFAGIGPIGHKLAAADFHVGAGAHTPSQHIIYNANNGFLYYDPDGKGPAAQVHFATLAAHLSLSHADFLVEA